jgi:hypothetical protein
VIELTCNEVQHPFAALVCRPAGDRGHRLGWSWWRRRHQARARACHDRRQAAQGPRRRAVFLEMAGGAAGSRYHLGIMIVRPACQVMMPR